jgi:hypothetical protein
MTHSLHLACGVAVLAISLTAVSFTAEAQPTLPGHSTEPLPGVLLVRARAPMHPGVVTACLTGDGVGLRVRSPAARGCR